MLRNPAPISVHYDQLLHGGLFQSLLEVRNSRKYNLYLNYDVPTDCQCQILPHIHKSPLLHKHLHPKLRNPAPTYFRSVPLLHGTHFLFGLPRYVYAAAYSDCYWKNWIRWILFRSSLYWKVVFSFYLFSIIREKFYASFSQRPHIVKCNPAPLQSATVFLSQYLQLR